MKFPVDVPPIRKALGIALVAAVAYVIVEGTGIGAPARHLWARLRSVRKGR